MDSVTLSYGLLVVWARLHGAKNPYKIAADVIEMHFGRLMNRSTLELLFEEVKNECLKEVQETSGPTKNWKQRSLWD